MKTKDNKEQEGFSPPDAALQFSQALQQLVEKSVNQSIQTLPEQVMHLSHKVNQIETKQQQFTYHFESIVEYLEKLLSINKLLEKSGNINQTLSTQHFEEHIINPMVRSLFVVIDLIDDIRKSSPTDKSRDETLDTIKSQLLQFFTIYGIEIVSHPKDSVFDPQVMKPVNRVSTQDKKLDRCVAQSLQSGFIWNKKRVLRPESVSLYKYESLNVNLTEEGELL